MIKCPSCGSDLRYDPAEKQFVCDYCGSRFDVQELLDRRIITAKEYREAAGISEPEDEASGQEEDTSTYEASVFTCPMCGGELLSTDETYVTFCSYCGSSVMLDRTRKRVAAPDVIIPFAVSKEDCEATYKKMLAGAPYVPTEIKTQEQIAKFRGIYMPYWVYSAEVSGPLTVRGERERRKGDYIYTDHYAIDTILDGKYDGIAYDASSTFSDSLSSAVAPFNFDEAQPFTPAYMSGFYADTEDVPQKTYEEDTARVVKSDVVKRLYTDAEFAKNGAGKEEIGKSPIIPKVKERLGYFPVWFLSFRSKTGDRVSYAVINGQTGEIAADLPVSFGKYFIGSLLIAVPIFLLLTLFATFTPRMTLLIAAALGAVGMIIANNQLNRVFMRDKGLDDKGLTTVNPPKEESYGSKKKTNYKNIGESFSAVGTVLIIVGFLAGRVFAPLFLIVVPALVFIGIGSHLKTKISPDRVVYSAPAKDKLKVMWKPLVTVILCAGMAIVNPFRDYVCYAGVIAGMALVCWCFLDIIKAHNYLTTRKLPQLGARGGDENA